MFIIDLKSHKIYFKTLILLNLIAKFNKILQLNLAYRTLYIQNIKMYIHMYTRYLYQIYIAANQFVSNRCVPKFTN